MLVRRLLKLPVAFDGANNDDRSFVSLVVDARVIVSSSMLLLGLREKGFLVSLAHHERASLCTAATASRFTPSQMIVWDWIERPMLGADYLDGVIRGFIAHPRVIVATSVNLPRGFNESLLLFLR